MNEFNNRIAAQREVLQLVNRKNWEKEELFGLSSKAIDRWSSVNRIDPESQLVKLIRTASSKLFFLANKSQEQVSEEYNIISREIAVIARSIDLEIG
ncbi:MAG TPA: hypothetical protein VK699_16735 [Terriglobales bacterium]|jgi:hypothetical protein|nr:hypothetical protein [Terriglobales bacterium]